MQFTRFVRSLALSLLVVPLITAMASAGPTGPISLEAPPAGQGDAFVPGTRLVEDLPMEYVEEEFFISGQASLYSYANNPPADPTDIVAVQEDIPYKTRIIVRRPAKAHKANGTVVIEWWNSTAGFDTAPAWDPSADYFANEGIVYVGVTNSTTSLGFLATGCRLLGFLPPSCGTRYSTLSLPANGLAYDIVNQLTHLLKSDDPNNPLPDNYSADLVLQAGESQQAGSVVTFASGFHEPGLSDGYFIHE